MPREDQRLIAETVKRFLDSSGDRFVIGDRESLMAAVERVKAHSNLRPDRIDRREINRRLQQYARAIGNSSFVTGSGDEIPHSPHRRI